MSIYQAINAAAVEAALFEPVIETRVAVNIRPGTVTHRFVQDTIAHTLGGDTWEPVPWAVFENIELGGGTVPDIATIRLDGRRFYDPASDTPDTALQNIVLEDLRDRPIQIGLIVLDPETKDPIGLKPEFVGFVDNVKLAGGAASQVVLQCISLRAYATRRTARVYSDTDHKARFPGDGALNQLSDVVFRRAKYSWNSENAQGGGIPGGGNNNARIVIGRFLR